MSIELKIKAMSLAAEAKIIRNQEQRITRNIRKRRARGLPDTANDGLNERLAAHRHDIRSHRIFDLRREARATCWARAFIAGKPKLLIENITHEIGKVEFGQLCALAGRMVLRFGGTARMIVPGDNRTDLDRAIAFVSAWATAPVHRPTLEYVAARAAAGKVAAQQRKAAGRKYWASKVVET